jgi:hypothetical protein
MYKNTLAKKTQHTERNSHARVDLSPNCAHDEAVTIGALTSGAEPLGRDYGQVAKYHKLDRNVSPKPAVPKINQPRQHEKTRLDENLKANASNYNHSLIQLGIKARSTTRKISKHETNAIKVDSDLKPHETRNPDAEPRFFPLYLPNQSGNSPLHV